MKKDYTISRLRVFFLFWILIYHTIDEYFYGSTLDIHRYDDLEILKSITNLVLQGFVFISGLLLARGYIRGGKYHKKWDFILEKIKRLLFPYLFWSVVLVFLYSVPPSMILTGTKHLWFLLMLFDVMILSAFLMPIISKSGIKMDICIICFFILAIVGMKYCPDNNSFGWQNMIMYMPPFLVGIYTEKYHLDEKLQKLKPISFWLCFIIVLSSAISFMLIPVLPFGRLYMFIPNYLSFPLLYVLVKKLFSDKIPSNVIQSIDRNSLGIYILHNFVGKYTLFHYVPGYVNFYDTHHIIAPVLLFLQMFLLAWLCSWIMHKNKYTKILLGV